MVGSGREHRGRKNAVGRPFGLCRRADAASRDHAGKFHHRLQRRLGRGRCPAGERRCLTWYSVIAGLLPRPALRLTHAAQAGDATETRRINDTFQPLWTLFQEFGSFRVMYAAADALTYGAADPIAFTALGPLGRFVMAA